VRMSAGKAFIFGAMVAAAVFAIRGETEGRVLAILLGVVIGFFMGISVEDRYDVLSHKHGGLDYRRRYGRSGK